MTRARANEARDRYFRELSIERKLVELEPIRIVEVMRTTCSHCKGRGWVRSGVEAWAWPKRCPVCSGAGR
jgi:Ribonuclease G/E